MAVTKTRDWATPSSSDPTGTATIGSGTNRTLILTQLVEYTGDFTASCAVGGVAATGVQKYFYDYTGGGDDLFTWHWWWDETDLESMSGNSISYSDNAALVNKRRWSYATFSSVDQSVPLVFTSAASESVSSANPLVINTPGASGDFTVIPICSRSDRSLNWDSDLTVAFNEVDPSAGGARFAIADTSWVDGSKSIGQSVIGGTLASLAVIVKQQDASSTIGGSGALTGIVPTVDGSGSKGINNLINPQPEIDAVGERVIVWQGGADLFAQNATTSLAPDGIVIFNDPAPTRLEPLSAEVLIYGVRAITGTGSAAAATMTAGGTGPSISKGSGSCEAAIALIEGGNLFDQVWYVYRTVWFGSSNRNVSVRIGADVD